MVDGGNKTKLTENQNHKTLKSTHCQWGLSTFVIWTLQQLTEILNLENMSKVDIEEEVEELLRDIREGLKRFPPLSFKP